MCGLNKPKLVAVATTLERSQPRGSFHRNHLRQKVFFGGTVWRLERGSGANAVAISNASVLGGVTGTRTGFTAVASPVMYRFRGGIDFRRRLPITVAPCPSRERNQLSRREWINADV